MAELKPVRDRLAGENLLYWPATGMYLRRVAAAIVWPFQSRQGCAIALGESAAPQPVLGISRRDVHVLREYLSDNATELVEMVPHISEKWLVWHWATPLCDRRVALLRDMADEARAMRRRKPRFFDPPGFYGKGEGLLPFYHALAQRRTLDEKTLFLGAGLGCADEIAAMRFEDGNRNILEWPAAAALCFALAEIDINAARKGRHDSGEMFGPADTLGGY